MTTPRRGPGRPKNPPRTLPVDHGVADPAVAMILSMAEQEGIEINLEDPDVQKEIARLREELKEEGWPPDEGSA